MSSRLGTLKIRNTGDNTLIVDAVIYGSGGYITSVLRVSDNYEMWRSVGGVRTLSGNSVWTVDDPTSTGFNIESQEIYNYISFVNTPLFLVQYNTDGDYYELQGDLMESAVIFTPTTYNYSIEVDPVATLCLLGDSMIITHIGQIRMDQLTLDHKILTVDSEYRNIYKIGKMQVTNSSSNPILYQHFKNNLVLTKDHSILLPDFETVEQKEKVVEYMHYPHVTQALVRIPAFLALEFSKYEVEGEYTVYHIALDDEDADVNFAMYANYVLVETCQKSIIDKMESIILG